MTSKHWTTVVKEIQEKYKLKSFKDAKNKWLSIKNKSNKSNKNNKKSKGGSDKTINNVAKKYTSLEKLINKFVNELAILKKDEVAYNKELIGGSKLIRFFTGLAKGLQSLGKIPRFFNGLNRASKLLARIIR